MRALRWLLFLLLAGCNGPTLDIPSGYSVSGKIYFPEGKPIPAGRLLLLPADTNPFVAFGDIRADGSFSLFNQKEEKSIVPGKYKVYVMVLDPRDAKVRARVPAKYYDFESRRSDVEVVISGDTSELEIRLKR